MIWYTPCNISGCHTTNCLRCIGGSQTVSAISDSAYNMPTKMPGWRSRRNGFLTLRICFQIKRGHHVIRLLNEPTEFLSEATAYRSQNEPTVASFAYIVSTVSDTALKPLSKRKGDRCRRRTIWSRGRNRKQIAWRFLCHLHVNSDRVRFEAHAVAFFLPFFDCVVSWSREHHF